jgi:hypothetical protein
MPVSGTLLVILGPAIAKTILGSWLNNSPLANAIASEIVDKLRDTIANPGDRQNTQREIERIGRQIAEQMRPIFDQEASHLDEGSRNAIQFAIASTEARSASVNSLNHTQRPEPLQKRRRALPTGCGILARRQTKPIRT